jgi:hypothetical protein
MPFRSLPLLLATISDLSTVHLNFACGKELLLLQLV